MNGNLSEHQFDQGQDDDEWEHGEHLFDPKPFDTNKHPGDSPFDEWSQLPGMVYHSTFLPEHAVRNNPLLHAGTQRSAEELLHGRANYRFGGMRSDQISRVDSSMLSNPHKLPMTGNQVVEALSLAFPESNRLSKVVESVNELGTYSEKDELRRDILTSSGRLDRGRIMARKLVGGVYPSWVSDSYANSVDSIIRSERDPEGGDTGSVQSSTSDRGRQEVLDSAEGQKVLDAVRGGTTLAYKNRHEDRGSISYVIPDWTNNTRGYWDDVIDSPNQSEWNKDMARRQKELGNEPEVAFSRRDMGVHPGTRPDMRNYHMVGHQGVLFTGGAGGWTEHPEGTFLMASADTTGGRHFYAYDPEQRKEPEPRRDPY